MIYRHRARVAKLSGASQFGMAVLNFVAQIALCFVSKCFGKMTEEPRRLIA